MVRPACLEQLAVVGRVPGLSDHRAQLIALDQHAALVVHGEARRADHALLAALAQPGRGGVEQRLEHLLVVLELEEAEPAPVLALVLVEGVVDLRADAPDDATVAPRQEVLGLAVAEEGVHAAAEEQPPLELQRGHPLRVVSMQAEREVDESLQISAARNGL